MLYDLAIGIYDLSAIFPDSAASPENYEGALALRKQLEKDVRYIWLHAASLGEF